MRLTATHRLLSITATTACLLTAAAPVRAETRAPRPAASSYTKVMVIVEENHTYRQVIGAPEAPYLTSVAARYGSALNMHAGYPAACPSLASYILMTSGSAAGICDDNGPKRHPLTGNNIFAQIAAAHLTARTYAEHIPGPCARRNSSNGIFLVRHTPIAYYTSEHARCTTDDIALGTLTSGALHHDVTTGTLPSYSFITPDACNDMHGAPSCPNHRVRTGDVWLAHWLPVLIHGPDYRAGRLLIIITWDEGSRTSNHIPTLLISPTTHGTTTTAYTHCSILRTTEDILGLPPIRCARTATSMIDAFHP